MVQYTARLTRNPKGSSFSVEFRHPMLLDNQSKPGRKIRKGLGADSEIAQQIINDLNELLSDNFYWSLDCMEKAKKEYNIKAVEIFYGPMEYELIESSYEQRNNLIRIPKSNPRVMLLGATGVGKTSIIRQLIGTEPNEGSFPAVSASRTTTCDTEYIFADGNWEAAVTFLTQVEVIQLISESVFEAFKKAVKGHSEKDIAAALLVHPEQRFRLSYLLGQYKIPKTDNRKADNLPNYAENYSELCLIVEKIVSLGKEIKEQSKIEGDIYEEEVFAIFEEWLNQHSSLYSEIKEEILLKVKSKFDLITEGILFKDNTGWPIYWSHSSTEKEGIFKYLKYFAGNDGFYFGKLLAPVVNGLRIKGPFKPLWWEAEGIPNWVIIDQEGLGHDSNVTTSLPLGITGKFDEVDAILVVDDASQPMLDIAKVSLRECALRGQIDKIYMTYTKFDRVEGANLLDEEDKEDHVLQIQNGAVESMKEAFKLDSMMIDLLKNRLSENMYLFPCTQQIPNVNDKFKANVLRLISDVETKFALKAETLSIQTFPKYDFNRLILVIADAEKIFMNKWLGLLGIERTEYAKQHWSRIKALANRFATVPGRVEYSDLMPVGDLASIIMQILNEFIYNPKEWSEDVSEVDKNKVLQNLSANIATTLNKELFSIFKVKYQNEWNSAWKLRGTRSTFERAGEIRAIYEQIIPKPTISFNSNVDDLGELLETIIHKEIEELL